MTILSRDARLACMTALYERMDHLREDVKVKADWYDRDDWRGQVHRRGTAREMRAIRTALRELHDLMVLAA